MVLDWSEMSDDDESDTSELDSETKNNEVLQDTTMIITSETEETEMQINKKVIKKKTKN